MPKQIVSSTALSALIELILIGGFRTPSRTARLLLRTQPWTKQKLDRAWSVPFFCPCLRGPRSYSSRVIVMRPAGPFGDAYHLPRCADFRNAHTNTVRGEPDSAGSFPLTPKLNCAVHQKKLSCTAQQQKNLSSRHGATSPGTSTSPRYLDLTSVKVAPAELGRRDGTIKIL
jgi:hypothetical protein